MTGSNHRLASAPLGCKSAELLLNIPGKREQRGVSGHVSGPVNCSWASWMGVCGGIMDPFCGCESHPRCRAADTASESPLGAVIEPLRPGCGKRRAVEFSCASCRERSNNLNALLSIWARRYHRGERTGAVYMPRQRMRALGVC